MTWTVDGMAKVFATVGWIVPPYIQSGELRKLAAAIDAAPAADKDPILIEGMKRFYRPPFLAVMLCERYSKTPHLQNYKAAVGEAIEAAALGLYNAAVTTLVPVVEGVLRKLAAARGHAGGNGTAWLPGEIEELIKHEANSSTSNFEREQMLTVFHEFVKNRFLQHTSRSADHELNRHGILHGIFQSAGNEGDFYRLVSFLDLLCFVVAVRTGGLSLFAPDDTPASLQLAEYYLALKKLEPAARAAKVRAGIT